MSVRKIDKMPNDKATCMYCRKKIGKGKTAICYQSGVSFFYHHPSCWVKEKKRLDKIWKQRGYSGKPY